MRQIFKTHPWVPPKELPETQELFRKYGVPRSILPGAPLTGKGEPAKHLTTTQKTERETGPGLCRLCG